MVSCNLLTFPYVRGGLLRHYDVQEGEGVMEKILTNLDKGREGGGQKSWKFCGHHMYMAPNGNPVHCARNNLRTCLEIQIQRVNYFLGNAPNTISCICGGNRGTRGTGCVCERGYRQFSVESHLSHPIILQNLAST